LNSEPTDVEPYPCATELIPWYVNGTLEAAEAARLEAHLKGCEACRREYEGQRRLFEAMQTDATLVFAAEPSFRKLMTRIGTHEDAGEMAVGVPATVAPVAATRSVRAPIRAVRWLAAAALIEGLGLGYGAWAWHAYGAAAPSSYMTLTSPAASYRDTPRIRIVFRSELSLQDLGVLLHRAGAHIIDGPTESNVYTLGFRSGEVKPADIEQRAAALRASSEVLFAEPLGTGTEGR
jgi:anti-sigma factor RsiW